MKIELSKSELLNWTPAHIRQATDTRPLWLRIRHWLYQVQNSTRKLAGQGKTVTDKDLTEAYYKKLQQKSSLFL